jgi:hypothetical protein
MKRINQTSINTSKILERSKRMLCMIWTKKEQKSKGERRIKKKNKRLY